LAPDAGYTVIASGLTNVAFTDTNAVLNATNYYVVTAANPAGESAPSSVAGILVVPYVPPPSSPSALSISAVGGQAALSWSASSNATAYTVKRTPKNVASSFSVIASGLTATSYIDSLTNSSLTYYYQVVAVNSGGESLPVTGSVKLSQAPALPWLEADVGNVGLAGGSGINGGTFVVQGAGATIYGAADGFHYLYMPLTNDGTLITRVADIMSTSDLADGWEKGGVMVRETLAPDARYCMVMMTSGQGGAFQYRIASGGTTARAQTTGLLCPYWVKLARAGDVFTAYHSADGYAWTQIGIAVTNAMAARVYAGLALSARHTNALNTATFDGFSIAVPGLNPPTELSATVLSESQVELSWADNSSLETAYAVERSPDGTNIWTMLSSILPPGATNYLDASLNPSSTYYFRLRCFNGGYASACSSVVGVMTPPGVGDGIPGWWRLQHFDNGLTTNSQTCASADPDGDRFTNLQEYLAGTAPLDSNSFFHISDIARDGSDILISFGTVTGRVYSVERTDSLAAGGWQTVTTNVPGTGSIAQIRQVGGATQRERFYRLLVSP
jgi:hypothetical protein